MICFQSWLRCWTPRLTKQLMLPGTGHVPHLPYSPYVAPCDFPGFQGPFSLFRREKAHKLGGIQKSPQQLFARGFRSLPKNVVICDRKQRRIYYWTILVVDKATSEPSRSDVCQKISDNLISHRRLRAPWSLFFLHTEAANTCISKDCIVIVRRFLYVGPLIH